MRKAEEYARSPDVDQEEGVREDTACPVGGETKTSQKVYTDDAQENDEDDDADGDAEENAAKEHDERRDVPALRRPTRRGDRGALHTDQGLRGSPQVHHPRH